ncbi:Uncharacterised protein [Helicobacter mustelae]|nr:Uncharacterised protein [Helicobacter mustelae]
MRARGGGCVRKLKMRLENCDKNENIKKNDSNKALEDLMQKNQKTLQKIQKNRQKSACQKSRKFKKSPQPYNAILQDIRFFDAERTGEKCGEAGFDRRGEIS